jgi:benzoyl-CoA reductase/2-hydroxyglutaryl-CoA dehydratase subunit BcrC/BadD/HgdB
MVMKELKIPTLMLEADMVDERSFSESQIETRIDAFMETLKS